MMLKSAMMGQITVETGALLLTGVMLFVSITRIMGSNVFRERSRIPKFLVSLTMFALSVADGDVNAAISVAIWTSALPICLFGLYICFRSAFGRI
jgi:hypothetical protein